MRYLSVSGSFKWPEYLDAIDKQEENDCFVHLVKWIERKRIVCLTSTFGSRCSGYFSSQRMFKWRKKNQHWMFCSRFVDGPSRGGFKHQISKKHNQRNRRPRQFFLSSINKSVQQVTNLILDLIYSEERNLCSKPFFFGGATRYDYDNQTGNVKMWRMENAVGARQIAHTIILRKTLYAENFQECSI